MKDEISITNQISESNFDISTKFFDGMTIFPWGILANAPRGFYSCSSNEMRAAATEKFIFSHIPQVAISDRLS